MFPQFGPDVTPVGLNTLVRQPCLQFILQTGFSFAASSFMYIPNIDSHSNFGGHNGLFPLARD